MKDKSKLIAIFLAIIIIIVVAISLITKQEETKKQNEVLIVTNASEFYTVNSCLYRTITYVSMDDKENLILLLNEGYRVREKITKDNVLDLFGEIEVGSTFVSEKMYYEKLETDLVKYYVSGHIEMNNIYDDEVINNTQYEQIYFIVYLDSENEIFSIELYDGEIFKKGDINEE